MSTDAYKSPNVECAYLSDAAPEECEALIGKTVARVDAEEYTLTLYFTDGSILTASGSRWGDSALGVSLEVAAE